MDRTFMESFTPFETYIYIYIFVFETVLQYKDQDTGGGGLALLESLSCISKILFFCEIWLLLY